MGLDCTHIKGRMPKILNKFRFLSDFWRPDRRLVKFEKKNGIHVQCRKGHPNQPSSPILRGPADSPYFVSETMSGANVRFKP